MSIFGSLGSRVSDFVANVTGSEECSRVVYKKPSRVSRVYFISVRDRISTAGVLEDMNLLHGWLKHRYTLVRA